MTNKEQQSRNLDALTLTCAICQLTMGTEHVKAKAVEAVKGAGEVSD